MFGKGAKRKNPLSGIGDRQVVGIDFSGGHLKLVRARISPNSREILEFKLSDISGLSDDEISKAIAASFKELKAKDPEILNTMPSASVITKNIEIPSVDPQEIKEIINLQAGRHTPYSREEIIVDYIDIDTYKHSYTKILLVFAARHAVKRQFAILDRAGIRCERLFFVPEALGRSAAALLDMETGDAPAGIVHVDGSSTDFAVILKDKALFVRSITIGASHLTQDREKNQPRFVEEIKRSLEAYQSENIEKNPQMLVLTGAIEGLKDLEMFLKNALPLPVRRASYLKNLMFSEGAQEAVSSASHVSFLDVIATIYSLQDMKVNLIPEEIALRKSLEERGRDLTMTGVFILTLLVLLFSILISKVYFKTVYLKNLDTRYGDLARQAQGLEKDFTRISLIKNYLSHRGFSLEVLSELYDLVPSDLELSDIRYEGQDKFNIRGTAGAMSTVFALVDRMEKSKYFKDVKTRYTAKRKDGLKDVTDFEIIALLSKE